MMILYWLIFFSPPTILHLSEPHVSLVYICFFIETNTEWKKKFNLTLWFLVIIWGKKRNKGFEKWIIITLFLFRPFFSFPSSLLLLLNFYIHTHTNIIIIFRLHSINHFRLLFWLVRERGVRISKKKGGHCCNKVHLMFDFRFIFLIKIEKWCKYYYT